LTAFKETKQVNILTLAAQYLWTNPSKSYPYLSGSDKFY